MPSSAALRRLLPYYRPYRAKVALGLLLVVLSSATASTLPWFLRDAVDAIRERAPIARIWGIAAAMIGVTLLTGAFRYGMRELLNGVSRFIEYDLRNDLFAHLLVLDAPFFTRMRTGDLMARATNDLGAVRMAVGPAIMYLTNTIFGGLFALAFMLRIDVQLTVVALLPMILMPLITVRLGRLLHDRFEEVQTQFATMTTMAQEHLAGVRIVRAYRQEGAEVARFAALGEEYLARNIRLARLYGFMHPVFTLLSGLGVVVVLGLGGTLVLRGAISVGSFVAFGFYLGMLTWPLIALGWVINLFQRGAASMRRLLDVLDAEPRVREPAQPAALPRREQGGAGGRTLEFRGVGFHYPMGAHTNDSESGRRVATPSRDSESGNGVGTPSRDSESGNGVGTPSPDSESPRWVLRNVSFTVPAGATLGVVGATGSGKSALMDLVVRLYDPQEGEILLDGVPLRDLSVAELRREIGYVPQESLLFSDTIGANLAYGAADAAAPAWAAAIAQLDETVRGFPGGYETMLGERGINLSGGQKQRASLARALARRPAVVLLDDALSAVDTHTEAEILHALRDALAGRTALVASHRVSAIRDATAIIVLEEGRIVERGTHAELLAAGGRYWSLLNRQQLEAAIEEGSPESDRADAVALADAGTDR